MPFPYRVADWFAEQNRHSFNEATHNLYIFLAAVIVDGLAWWRWREAAIKVTAACIAALMGYSLVCKLAFKLMPRTLTYLSVEGVAGVLDAHHSQSAEDMTTIIRSDLRLRCSRGLSEFLCERPMDDIRKWCGVYKEDK